MTDFDALWNYDDPLGTEVAFRILLKGGAQSWPDARRAELLSQIARTLGLQGKFTDADELLNQAERLANGDTLAEARVLLEQGRVRNSSGRKEEAHPLFEKALAKADEAGAEFFAVDAVHMLAIVSPPEKAMDWHREGIARAEKSQDPKTRGWLGSLCNNLGWSLHESGSFDEALMAFQKALEYRLEQGKEGPVRIAKWCVARCLRSQNHPAQALEMQRTLHQECASAGAPDGFVEEEIAECLLALGRSEEAKPHFAEAHELLSQDASLVESDPARLSRLKELGTPL